MSGSWMVIAGLAALFLYYYYRYDGKVAFGELCKTPEDVCTGEGAVCRLDDGDLKCRCDMNQFWDNRQSKCKQKVAFGELCKTPEDVCADKGAVCQQNDGDLKCLCDINQFWDNRQTMCRQKIQYGEMCHLTDDRCAVAGSVCRHESGASRCVCRENEFLDAIRVTCERMPYVGNGNWRKYGNLWDDPNGEKWVLSCDEGYYVSGCSVIRNFNGTWNKKIPTCQSIPVYWAKTIVELVVTGLGAIFVVAAVLRCLGFGPAGIAGKLCREELFDKCCRTYLNKGKSNTGNVL